MKAKRKWYQLLLPGLAALLVLVTGTVQTANAYEYVKTGPEPYEYESDPIYNSFPTYYEEATADADAYENGSLYLYCGVYTKAWSKGHVATADADAYGFWMIHWTWDGPPGGAPGGTLDWSLDATGETNAWGYNWISYPETQGAQSASFGDSNTGAGGTSVSAYSHIRADGYAFDYDEGGGRLTAEADPPEDLDDGTPTEVTFPGGYSFGLNGWVFDTGDEETIPAYTTLVQFAGGIDCEAVSVTSSGGTGEYYSQAEADAISWGSVSAEFEPNE